MKYLYKGKYLKRFARLSPAEQSLVVAADKEIRNFYKENKAPRGLGIKKLYDNGKERTYEARASISIRIVWVEAEGTVAFVILGTHDEVRRYIRSFR